MAIFPERKNALVLSREFRDRITRRTGINDFDSDSKTEAMIYVYLKEILDARDNSANAFAANQLSTAIGEQLDTIGKDKGIARFGELFAYVGKRDQNFAWYVESGTFGSLNSGVDISIPAGTIISSQANNNDLGATIQFALTEDVILPASSSLVYFSAQATTSGTFANVGAGIINQHSFSNYTAGTGLKVINFFSILTGRGAETDRNYRYRLSRKYDMLASSNNTKLHLTALNVPGVLDTRIIGGYYGIGTVAVIVLGPENQSDPKIVRAVQDKLNTLQGSGDSIFVISASVVQFDIALKVKLNKTLTVNEKKQFELKVKRALRIYLRGLGLGATVSIKDAAIQLRSYAGSEFSFSSLGEITDIFDKIYIRRGTLDNVTERERLDNSVYSLEQDEYATLGTLTIRYLS